MRIQNYIVTLCCDKWYLTKQFLSDLYRHEIDNIEQLIVVNNGSGEETKTGLAEWLKSAIPMTVLTLAENVGFTLGANLGLEFVTKNSFAERKAVFLISNDVRIHGKFINQATDFLFGARRYLIGNTHITFDSGWNKFDGKIFDYLDGSFLATTSDGWRDLGFFDENYAPGDFEDVDISTFAKQKGYKLVALNNPNIIHLVAGTTGYTPEREERTRKNREYFRKKWLHE